MSSLEMMLAERACKRLMMEYVEWVDTRQFDRLVNLFTKRGVLARPDTGELKGHAAIKEFFDQIPEGPFIHSASNILVTVTGSNVAKASSYVTVFRSCMQNSTGLPKLEPAYLIAKYIDKFTIENGEWKIAYRDTIFLARE